MEETTDLKCSKCWMSISCKIHTNTLCGRRMIAVVFDNPGGSNIGVISLDTSTATVESVTEQIISHRRINDKLTGECIPGIAMRIIELAQQT